MGLEKLKLIDKEDARDIQEHHDLLADLADFTDTAKRMELVRTMKKVKKPLNKQYDPDSKRRALEIYTG